MAACFAAGRVATAKCGAPSGFALFLIKTGGVYFAMLFVGRFLLLPAIHAAKTDATLLMLRLIAFPAVQVASELYLRGITRGIIADGDARAHSVMHTSSSLAAANEAVVYRPMQLITALFGRFLFT